MTKTKIYDLCFSDWDGNSSYQFTHPNNKLRAEFEQDVQDTLRANCLSYMENGGEFSVDGWLSYIGAPDLIRMVSEKLPGLGYIPLEKSFDEIAFVVDGSNILNKKDSGDDQIKSLLGKELTSAVFTHNEQVKKQTNGK